MKLTVLGGGGVRSPFLAKSIVAGARKIGITQVVFMDDNAQKLATFGTMAREIARMIDPSINFQITTDPVEALDDASFIITTLRVGGDAGRVLDERIALDCGVLGQETTGAGGFAMALRSIPALKTYCELAAKHCREGALIFNFTNPSGLVTQALRAEGHANVYGVCDSPSGFKSQIQKMLAAQADDLTFTCFGLNHLSWFKDIRLKGEDITDELMQDERLYRETEMRMFDRDLVRLSGRVLLNEYLYFYYYRERAIASILSAGKTRGETILEINERMLRDIEPLDLGREMVKAFDIYMSYYLQRENSYMAIESQHSPATVKKPMTLAEFVAAPDHGGYAGVALKFIEAYHNGDSTEMVLSVPNEGAIEGLEADDVVEITCHVDKGGATPMKVGCVPELQMNLIRNVKYFEKTAAAAIRERSRDKATVALTAHPLVNSYPIATKLVEGYLQAHQSYAGHWN